MSHIRLAHSSYSLMFVTTSYRYYHDSVVVAVASDNMAVNRAFTADIIIYRNRLPTLTNYAFTVLIISRRTPVLV